MAAKRKKAKKAKAVKARKAKRAPAKKSRRVAKKAAKTPAKKKKAVKAARKKASARKPAKKTKRKQIVGEGDYQASRTFDKAEASFVKKNKARIPALGKEAEKALEGPEGDSLRDAEATAAARSRDLF